MRRWLILVSVACTPRTDASTDPSDTDTAHPGTETGTDGACPPDVVPTSTSVCAETTAALPTPGAEVDHHGAGRVSEVGGVLVPVPSSVPVDGFLACGAETHQVRLIDSNGDSWTFGWTPPEGPDADANGFSVGADVELRLVVYGSGTFDEHRALLLSDASGPLFLLEREPTLTPAERGDLDVGIDLGDTCYGASRDLDHFLVTFTGPEGAVALRSGGTARIGLSGREVRLVLANASMHPGCGDGGPSAAWMMWAD